jgi:hypothetical protein
MNPDERRVSAMTQVLNRLAKYPLYPEGPGYFLIVPDHASGRRSRYTVYIIPASPSGRVRVVGRELPLRDCRRLINVVRQRAH